MKISKYIVLSGVLALGLTSCSDWLDCNVNPDSPNNESILVENRLPWIQKEFTYAAGCANTRTFATCGGFYSNNANMYNVSVTWDGVNATGLTTTPYQTFFCGTSSNIPDMYNKAAKEDAYHYMGAARVMHALGFMLMADLYGEIPFTEANTANAAPAYDNGITIWEGCLAEIDEAIELFSKPQPATATPLSSGDIWNGGDVNKWIKLCYGLKARWLLRVTKNADHYDPEAILAALAKGPQSINDDTYQLCFDEKGDKTDFLLGDPIMTNGNWDTAAYGKTQWFSKYHLDLLTNLRGAGVEDPRIDAIVPHSMTNIVLQDGKVKSYEWRRAVGVDMFGDVKRLQQGGNNIAVQTLALADKTISYKFEGNNADKEAGFVAGVKSNGYTEVSGEPAGRQYKVDGSTVTVCYPAGAWYVNSTNFAQAGDTAYVNINAGSQNTNNGTWGMPALDTYYHSNDQAAAVAGAVSGTSSFQIYPVSDFDIVTYAEMCFIKAEILMRKGDTGGALTAYKAGIQANFDRMQKKLNSWKGTGYENPNMQPMDAAKISAYMTSAAVCQNAGQLKMQDIMLQKYIAMGWSMENWVDMRRFNYSAGNVGNFGVIYPNYGRTVLFNSPRTFANNNDPQNVRYWFRRWRLPGSLELNYNQRQALAMNAHALDDDIWSMPCFWDCANDAEYLNYLK